MNPAIPAPPGTVAPPPAAPTVPPQAPAVAVPDEEIRVYGHSNMVYWWPVWALGFLFALLTYLDGNVMAVVPTESQVKTEVLPDAGGPREVIVPPSGKELPKQPGAVGESNSPRLMVAASNNYGVVFVASILLVIVITNFIFRGLVSILVVAAIAVVVLFIALMGWWDHVLAWFGGLDVRMNAGGYLAVSVPLFLIWAFSTFVYDHYTYLIVTRGQVRICQAIGDAEVAVDSSGLMLTKERNDLFRHWLLGLGTGDLQVKTGGPANLDFELHNVAFIGTKLARIQNMLREKEVAEQGPGG